ncbi:hypothetical protein [Methylibium sp.]|uniref:hypothetical protein n=1 Tax=Methylibium sp. TaxID=2067992 RepID=UPI003D0C49A2
MRAAPAVTVMVRPGGRVRAALWLLAALAVAVTAVWAVQRADGLAAIAVALVTAGAAWLLWQDRCEPVLSLRWDGAVWWLGPASGAAEPQPGRVAVALDLDGCLLLRFRADAPGPRRSTRWLPLQRRGLEADWHALRCAAYSPAASRDVTLEHD